MIFDTALNALRRFFKIQPKEEILRGAPIRARDAISFNEPVSNETINKISARDAGHPTESVPYYTEKERERIFAAADAKKQKEEKLTIPHLESTEPKTSPERVAFLEAKMNAARVRLAEVQGSTKNSEPNKKTQSGEMVTPPELYDGDHSGYSPEQRL